jgi:HEAT repeat protein
MSFFDPLSFAIGAGVGTAIGAGGVYILKSRLPGITREGDEEAASTDGEPSGAKALAREFLAPQAGRRYVQEIRYFFQHMHLPGEQLALTDVLIEPRLLRNRPPSLTIEEDEEGIVVETDLYRVIPFIHQFPAIYASFHMETISIKDLESGEPHAAILGIPGTGKSTTLAVLGLLALGAINLDDLHTETETQFDYADEERDLPEDVRERRRKEREEVQARAIKQLRIIQKREEEVAEIERRDSAIQFEGMFPIYVHLRDIDLNPATYGGKIDPAEPIVRAQFRYLNKSTAEFIPPMFYRMLSQGQALLLIDGYDELTPQERETYLDWLQSLLQFYGKNFIIITGPASGYDALVTLGFATTFMAPLNTQKIEELRRKWTAKWGEIGTLPPDDELRSLVVDNRNRMVLDLTMKIWAILQGDLRETGRRGYYESYVRRQVGEIDGAMGILQDMAAHWLDTGHAPNPESLREIVGRRMGSTQEIVATEAEDKKKSKKAPPSSKEDKVLRQIAQTQLVHEQPNGAFAFRHPVIGWYLAGETLQTTNRLAELAENPNWHGALGFAAAIVDLEPAVLQKARMQPDLLFSHMFSVVEWMPDAPAQVRWKGEILKRLGTVFLMPNQFPAVREFACAALVASRDDTGGVVYLFRQAIRSGNAVLRRLGSIGLGAIGSTDGIKDLNQMLFDELPEVQLAAGLALGAIGTEEALTAMTEALLSGDPPLRKAVAESFAAIPGEGHAILRDGIVHEDLEVRRACAFGLARVPAIWALTALYRAMLEDSQWYVRQAAERAFAHAREPRSSGPVLYPEPVYYEWLKTWASTRGESVPEGPGGRQLLMTALQQAPGKVRVECARALGNLGHLPAVKTLYATLGDQDAEVRSAAFGALTNISYRTGKPLPGLS